MAPLFPPRADPRFTTVTSDSTVNKLIEQGYNVHCGSTPTVFSRPVLSSQRETVSMTHICSTVRVVAHIMTDAPWWRIGYGSWTGGLGVVWGEDGTEAAQQNLAEKSPFASNQTENPTLWVAMIRALETAPDGVDIEIRLTRAYREDRGHQKDECPYHVFSMMSPGWVSQWQTNGWTRSSYYGGGPVRYQDLIKYLLFLEEKRTGNVFYVYVDGKELDEEEIEGENNRGFEAAKALALCGARKPDPPNSNWSRLVPPSIKAKRRFQSSQNESYKKQYESLCQQDLQVPWAFSRRGILPPISQAKTRHVPCTKLLMIRHPRNSASPDAEHDMTTDELADRLASVNV